MRKGIPKSARPSKPKAPKMGGGLSALLSVPATQRALPGAGRNSTSGFRAMRGMKGA